MNRVREAIVAIRSKVRDLRVEDGLIGHDDRLTVLFDAALLACDEVASEWTKARDAQELDRQIEEDRKWKAREALRRWDAGAACESGANMDVVRAYFATINWDTNRVCPKCLHQYNDRVNHVCKKEGL